MGWRIRAGIGHLRLNGLGLRGRLGPGLPHAIGMLPGFEIGLVGMHRLFGSLRLRGISGFLSLGLVCLGRCPGSILIDDAGNGTGLEIDGHRLAAAFRVSHLRRLDHAWAPQNSLRLNAWRRVMVQKGSSTSPSGEKGRCDDAAQGSTRKSASSASSSGRAAMRIVLPASSPKAAAIRAERAKTCIFSKASCKAGRLLKACIATAALAE
ncbi:hypothetical protein ACVILI_000628 [Mesorhizobium sp. USDA 4775]